MKPEWNSAIGRLRIIGLLEGCSWLLLLFIAMPLKYMADKPQMVKYTGWAHGLLFMLYLVLLLSAWSSKKLTGKMLVFGGLASILPFGTWIYDKQLKKIEQ